MVIIFYCKERHLFHVIRYCVVIFENYLLPSFESTFIFKFRENKSVVILNKLCDQKMSELSCDLFL